MDHMTPHASFFVGFQLIPGLQVREKIAAPEAISSPRASFFFRIA